MATLNARHPASSASTRIDGQRARGGVEQSARLNVAAWSKTSEV